MSAQGTDNGVWGGVNITEAALEVQSAISTICRARETCDNFVTVEVPQCLQFHGSASCWCSPDSPLLDCAGCMANPTDGDTTFQQTDIATRAIQAYKAGCQAYSASLSGSTTLSLATTSTGSSVMPLPTLHTYQDSPGLSTGAISGIASGAVSFASLCIFAGYLWYKESQNRRRIDPVTPMVVRRQAPADQEFVGPIRVMTHASGTRIDLEGGPDEIPEVPQRLPRSRRPSQA